MSEGVLLARLLEDLIGGPCILPIKCQCCPHLETSQLICCTADGSAAKVYHPVSLLSVVSKVFEKLVNSNIVDHLEKCDIFSDFH